MKWESKTPEPHCELDHGALRLQVSPAQHRGDEQWQHCSISFGRFSNVTMEDCCQTWPREAIAEARRILNEFESTLQDRIERLELEIKRLQDRIEFMQSDIGSALIHAAAISDLLPRWVPETQRK